MTHATRLKALFVGGFAALVAGCATQPAEYVPPVPVETPDVALVKSQILAYDTSIPLATVFEQYGLCDPKTRTWEEMEPGRVMFSCYFDDGSLMQWEFRISPEKTVTYAQFHYTSQNDADFAAQSLRGPDAEDALKAVYMNQPPF